MSRSEILAVIHARGGSKRIPLKNLAPLGGKPLIAYPILLAKASRHITRVIVSSDHDGIMEEAKRWGAEIPFRRPADISEDVASEMVTLHALDYLKEKENYQPVVVVTLTPATPFTQAAQVDEGIDRLLAHPEWDSVIAVRRAAEHPEWMFWRDETQGTYQTILGNPLNGKYNVSQNLQKTFYPVGAFFINRPESLRTHQCLYGKTFGAVELDPARHVDIDTPEDLRLAASTLGELKT